MHFYKLSSRLWGDVIKVWVWKTSRKNTLAKSVIHKLTKVFLVRNPKFEVGVSMNLKHTKGWHVISETLKTRLVCNYTPTSFFFRWFVKTWRATNQSDFRFWPERQNRAFVFFLHERILTVSLWPVPLIFFWFIHSRKPRRENYHLHSRGIMKLKHRDNFSSFSTARVIFTRSYRDGASAEKYFYQPTSVAGTKNSDRCGTNIKNFPPKAPGRHDYTLVQKKLVCLH